MSPQQPGSLVLLMPREFATELLLLAKRLGYDPVRIVNTAQELREAFASAPPRVLLAFCTGVVVPADILQRPGLLAANVHGAPPAYPGRDPHHFAAYEGAASYGATLHFMTRQVDQGPIIRASAEPVPPQSTPAELMAIGVRHGADLAAGFLEELATRGAPRPDPAVRWSGPVRRRSDFLALCRIDAGIGREEFERRLRATSMPGFRNLTLSLHGRTFRIEPE